MSYDPEQSIAELRVIRATEPGMAEIAPVLDHAAERARELWPASREREQAGLGAIVAAATLAGVVLETGDRQLATLLNMVGLFGLSLVDGARAELART